MSNLSIRVLSAFIYFPLLLLSAYYQYSFVIVVAVLAILAWHEYLSFRLKPASRQAWAAHGALIFVACLPLVAPVLKLQMIWGWVALGFFFQTIVVLQMRQRQNLEELQKELSFFLWGILYITALFSSLVFLQAQRGGSEAVWFLFFVVGASDTGAYFVGRHFGSTPFFQKLSPSKTREGFLGGLFAAVVVCVIYSFAFGYFDFRVPEIWFLIALGLVVSVASTFGDLFESMLKRHFGVKDSGRTIPGHGGVLDRFDGVLFAALPLLFFVLVFGGFRPVF